MRTWTTVSMLLLLAPAVIGCERPRAGGGEPPPASASREKLQTAEAAELEASDGATDDRFGHSVDVDGDRIVVGTRGVDRAYVYEWDGSGWNEEPLVPDEVSDNASFGSSVAIDGDTAVVGAAYDYAGGLAESGSVHVFTHTGSGWVLQQKLTAPDPVAGDELGSSVDIDGDTLIAGARYGGRTSTGSGPGAAFVFTRSSGTWSWEDTLRGDATTESDHFGVAVALHADTAIVGAKWDAVDGMASAGAAYVFARGASGGTWSRVTRLTASDAEASDSLGSAVAFDGTTIVAGTESAGAAYVFEHDGSGWVEVGPLTASSGPAIGYEVAVQDGVAVVGAELGPETYTFTRMGGSWQQDAITPPTAVAAGDDFGTALALDGTRLVAGSPRLDLGAGAQAGAVWVYEVLRETDEPCGSDAVCATGVCAAGVCCETGCAPDAGTDAGPDDAGALDGGADAGPVDAGTDAGPADAGSDAGTADDAGAPDAGGGTDAGAPDAGRDDAGAETDAGAPDAGAGRRSGDGCGCRAMAGATPSSAGFAVVLALLLGRRRRRRR